MPRAAGERGSLPLTLLVVIVMAGVLGVMVSRAVAEQRSTRFTSEYSGTLHAAEAGVDQALLGLNTGTLATIGTVCADEPTARCGQSAAPAADGTRFTWRARFVPAQRVWQVVSTGRGPAGVDRTVVASIQDDPVFSMALATHLSMDFGGGNNASSYSSVSQTRCSGFLGAWPAQSTKRHNPACFGIVASNGNIAFGGAGSGGNYADQVRIHDTANPQKAAQVRCTQETGEFCRPPIRSDIEDPLDIYQNVGLAERLRDACAGSGGAHMTYLSNPPKGRGQGSGKVSTVTLNPDATSMASFRRTITVNGSSFRLLCLEEAVFNEDTVLAATVTAANPLLVYVRTALTVERHAYVNCPGCPNNSAFPSSPNMPAARRLQIFSLARDEATGNNARASVTIEGQAQIAAAIYAPYATCRGQADVRIYGAMVCNRIDNATGGGGWEFHYDEDLMNGLSTNQFLVNRWSEE